MPTLPGSPAAPAYTICSQTGLSGISVGWGDWYPAYLYGQWVDLGQTPLADGNYVVRSVADPDNLIWESPDGADQSRESQADNQAVTRFRVTGGVIYEQLLKDGFESGLAAWSRHPGVTVQSTNVFSGKAAARATASGSPAYLSHDIVLGRNTVRLDTRFDLVSQGTQAGLAAIRTSAGRTIGTVFVGAGGRLPAADRSACRGDGLTRTAARDHCNRPHPDLAGRRLGARPERRPRQRGRRPGAARGRRLRPQLHRVIRRGAGRKLLKALFGLGQLADHALLGEPGADGVHERLRLLDERHVGGLLDHHQP